MNRLLTLVPLLTATLAFAEPPAPESPVAVDDPVAASTKATVQKVLLKPLAAREVSQSRFSRSRQPAQARRVRVLQAEPVKDTDGKQFVTFAVDARHGFDPMVDEVEPTTEWRKDTITGCVYPDSGDVFVKRGNDHYASGILLGKKTKAADKSVCVSGPAQVASRK